MKNKNIKSKLQNFKNVIDGFSCILDFPKFSGPRPPLSPPPPIKGKHQLNLQNLSSTTTAAKGTYKKVGKSRPIKQSTRNLSLGYTEIEKRRRALGQDLFCVICNWAV